MGHGPRGKIKDFAKNKKIKRKKGIHKNKRNMKETVLPK